MSIDKWVKKVWLEEICDGCFIKHCLLTCEGKRKIEQLAQRQIQWPSADSHSGDIVADVGTTNDLDYVNCRFANLEETFIDEVCGELYDFIIECIETNGELEFEDSQLAAVLGTYTTTYHALPFTTSYYDSQTLVLYEDVPGKAYLLFESRSGRGLPYSGRFKEFSSVDHATEYIASKYEKFESHEMAILKSIYRDIEDIGDR